MTHATALRLASALLVLSAGCSGSNPSSSIPPATSTVRESTVNQSRERTVSLHETGRAIALPPVGGMRESIALPRNDARTAATLDITVESIVPAAARLPSVIRAPFAAFTLQASGDVAMRTPPAFVVKLPPAAPANQGALYAWLYDVSAKRWRDLGAVAATGSTIAFGGRGATLRLRAGASYVVVPFTAPPGASCPTIDEFPLPVAVSEPLGIAPGPDGNLWFTEDAGNRIGRITTAGTITEFPLPQPESLLRNITSGPDSRLWFTEASQTKSTIGAITTTGAIVQFTLPITNSQPLGIAVGPDGNIWFTESNPFAGNKIGRISTSGSLTEFAIPTPASVPFDIAPGPDGNLWFTEFFGNKIGRITTSGTIDEFTIATPLSEPRDITTGPDGRLWFTESFGARIGAITTGGSFAEFDVGPELQGITSGPSGSLWFGDAFDNYVGSITTGGAVNKFTIPTHSSFPFDITTGPDGNVWFTEFFGNKIGKLIP